MSKIMTEFLDLFFFVRTSTLFILAKILFVCCFTSQINSYGHGRVVSSPNHTF